MSSLSGREEFINPLRTFRGEFSPENLVLDANLQEFANRVGIICALENSGKLSPHDAYDQIKDMWHELEHARHNLLE